VKKKSIAEHLQVKGHYEHWPFPGADFLSREGLLLMRYFERWIRQEGQGKKQKSKVIDVGCGTGHTTIALAKNFPEASFLGIDISEKSIQTAGLEAKKKNLSNVAFQNHDLRADLSTLGKFDIVLCLGVFHHVEDPAKTFRNIAHLVNSQGYLVLWLYGRLGRFHHNANQEFLRLLTKNSEKDESLEVARSFLKDLGARFATDSGFYTPKGSGREGLSWLLNNPQWVADQMIPVYERRVTIQDILRLFEENSIKFWRWLGIPTHLNKYTSSEKLLERFGKLPTHEQLVAIDYLTKPAYYFVVGRKFKTE
jgi:SAM-dependent methyltransferase